MLDAKPISVSVKDAVKLTGIGERTIRERIRTGDIPSKLRDGRRLVLYTDLETYIRGGA